MLAVIVAVVGSMSLFSIFTRCNNFFCAVFLKNESCFCFYVWLRAFTCRKVTNLWGEYVIWLFLLICSLNYSHHKYNTKLYNHVKEME